MTRRITIDRFYGGKAEDPYKTNAIQFDRADHLDIYSQDGRMIPYRTSVSDETGQFDVGNFVYTGGLWGLGEPSGSNATAVIYTKSSFFDGDWEVATTGTAGSGTGSVTTKKMFFEYNGNLFWGSALGRVHRYNIASPTQGDVNNWNSITNATGFTDGFHFKKNDTAYFAYTKSLANGGNGIASWDGTTFVSEDFTFPATYDISAISEYGNYLAIAVNSKQGNPDSKVFFWDTIKATADFVKDVPEGDIVILKNIDGRLVAVAQSSGEDGLVRSKLSFFIYEGGEFVRVKQYTGGTEIIRTSQKDSTVRNNQLFFTSNFQSKNGIYRFGLVNGQWSFSLDRYVTSGNTETFNSVLAGALTFVNDVFFCVHTTEGNITRSDTSANYITPIYDTGYLDGGDKATEKRLREVSVVTDPLPSGGQIVVKAAVDGSSTFTTILTHDTDDAVKLVSRNVTSIADFSFIQFRMEIGGNTQPVELSFVYDEKPSQTVS